MFNFRSNIQYITRNFRLQFYLVIESIIIYINSFDLMVNILNLKIVPNFSLAILLFIV
jgi:hypothetical protein